MTQEMEFKLTESGIFSHNVQQQEWIGSEIYQYALFSGQEMLAMRESDESPFFELQYLGYKTDKIESMEKAKKMAPFFAKDVLTLLCARITV